MQQGRDLRIRRGGLPVLDVLIAAECRLGHWLVARREERLVLRAPAHPRLELALHVEGDGGPMLTDAEAVLHRLDYTETHALLGGHAEGDAAGAFDFELAPFTAIILSTRGQGEGHQQ